MSVLDVSFRSYHIVVTLYSLIPSYPWLQLICHPYIRVDKPSYLWQAFWSTQLIIVTPCELYLKHKIIEPFVPLMRRLLETINKRLFKQTLFQECYVLCYKILLIFVVVTCGTWYRTCSFILLMLFYVKYPHALHGFSKNNNVFKRRKLFKWKFLLKMYPIFYGR